MDWLRVLIDRLTCFLPRVWICPPQEEGVYLTFGKYAKPVKAGWYLWIPLIHKIYAMNVKTQVVDLRIQSVRSACGTSLAISGAIQYRITNIQRATLDVQNVDISLTTMALGIISDFVQSKRLEDMKDTSNLKREILEGIRESAQGWGLKIEKIYITDFDKARNIRLLTNGIAKFPEFDD